MEMNVKISELPINQAILSLAGNDGHKGVGAGGEGNHTHSSNTQVPAAVPSRFADWYISATESICKLAHFLKPFGALNLSQHPPHHLNNNGSSNSGSGSSVSLNNSSNCNSGGALSRSMQRKLVTLINCQLLESEGRARAVRAARSLGERTVTELILHHQNHHQLSANLWAAVRARGCQFLGPGTHFNINNPYSEALESYYFYL